MYNGRKYASACTMTDGKITLWDNVRERSEYLGGMDHAKPDLCFKQIRMKRVLPIKKPKSPLYQREWGLKIWMDFFVS